MEIRGYLWIKFEKNANAIANHLQVASSQNPELNDFAFEFSTNLINKYTNISTDLTPLLIVKALSVIPPDSGARCCTAVPLLSA